MVDFPHICDTVDLTHMLETMVEKIYTGMLVINRERLLVGMNPWLLNRLKTKPETILGKNIYELFPELTERRINHSIDMVFDTGITHVCSYKLHQYVLKIPSEDSNGQFEWMPQTIFLVPVSKDGKVDALVGIIYDVTDRVLAEQNMRQELNKLENLHFIDQTLSALNIQERLNEALDQVKSLFNAESVNLFLSEGGELFRPWFNPVGVGDSQQIDFVKHVRTNNQPLILNDVLKQTVYQTKPIKYQSEMAVPLVIKNQVIGVVQVCAEQKENFVSDDLTLLMVVASRLAQSIHNAGLHEQERQQRLLAQALTEITLSIASELEVEIVLDRILDAIQTVVPYDSASLFLEENGKIQVQRHRGYDHFGAMEAIDMDIWDLSKMPLVREMMSQNRPVSVLDVNNEPRWFASKSAAHVRSWVGVPINIRGTLMGFISLDKTEPNFYTLERIAPLESFAASAGIAIQNAKLYARQVSLANLDGLTGLPNRRSFDKRLAEEMQRTVCLKHPTSLVIFDVDHFKQFNDTYGHLVGDDVLKQIAKILNQNLRMMDIPARFGGEEFAIILPHTNLDDAYLVAERLRKIIESQQLFVELNLTITISLGVATAPEHGITPNQLTQAADEALYQAKNNGRNQTKKAILTS